MSGVEVLSRFTNSSTAFLRTVSSSASTTVVISDSTVSGCSCLSAVAKPTPTIRMPNTVTIAVHVFIILLAFNVVERM